MKLGPAKRLVKFAKECKDKKLRAFSTYKTKKDLREVLRKYRIDSSKITKIPPFEPELVEIDDENEEFKQCITEIKHRMGIISSATGRNEAEYIFQYYMHPSILPKESLRKELPWTSSSKLKRKASVVFNDEFDYLYEIVTTASDWYFLMYTPERIYCSKDDYHIVLNEKIMKDNAEFHRGIKKVMEVIVSSLKNRVKVGDSPDKKRARTKKFIKE
ncbi:unnamed protein product [Rhizophagus irregularis]|nr:unnamed protein product [Rhizophagus irregularis]